MVGVVVSLLTLCCSEPSKVMFYVAAVLPISNIAVARNTMSLKITDVQQKMVTRWPQLRFLEINLICMKALGEASSEYTMRNYKTQWIDRKQWVEREGRDVALLIVSFH